ncbi:MAG: ABC transporter permease [Thermoanaerobaculia bacterium]
MNGFLQDLRFAARLLRRSPGFALGSILILGFGIAANITLFGVVNAVLLKPLPFRNPERLYSIVTSDVKQHFRAASSPPDFLDYRRSVPSFDQVAASMPWTPNITDDGRPERLKGLLVSANFFSMIGVPAVRGRTFLAEEERPGNERAVLLSDAFWRSRFGADPSLVGRGIRLNGEDYRVVGVMPPGFRWGRAYGQSGVVDLWAPFALTPARIAADQRGNEYLDVIARLRAGASRAAAQGEVDALFEEFRRNYPENFPRGSGLTANLVPLQADLVEGVRAPLWILLGSVGFLLAIACTNVAGLFLAKASARQSEIAIRVSLGATRGRLLRQLLTESSLLAALAGLGGSALAVAALAAIRRRGFQAAPGLERASFDAAAAGFSLGISALTAVVFGLLPASGALKSDLRGKADSGRRSSGRTSSRLRRWLVASQMGLATLLLIGAGLLATSLYRLMEVDPGFESRRVLTARLSLPRAKYPDPAARARFTESVLARLRSEPGIRSAGMAEILPLAGDVNSSTFAVEGRSDDTGEAPPHAESWRASVGYFETLRIPLLRGRLFDSTDRDNSLPVLIVDEALAKKYFRGRDPIGKRIDFEGDRGARQWRFIVGVVGTIRARALDDEPVPAFYVPLRQRPAALLALVARFDGSAARGESSLRSAVAREDPDQPVANVAPLAEILSSSVSQKRLAAAVLAAFASTALLLAAIGLYGVLAYFVAQRRREIGIRIALGARPAAVLRLVLGESARMIGAGVAAGLGIAFVMTRWLATMLYGVAPRDPVVFAVVAATLTAVGLVASGLPARRAATTDPMEALRSE